MKYSELGEGWSPRYFDANYPYATKGDIIGARLDITLADASSLDDAEWDIVAVHASKAPELGAELGALGWQPPTVL